MVSSNGCCAVSSWLVGIISINTDSSLRVLSVEKNIKDNSLAFIQAHQLSTHSYNCCADIMLVNVLVVMSRQSTPVARTIYRFSKYIENIALLSNRISIFNQHLSG